MEIYQNVWKSARDFIPGKYHGKSTLKQSDSFGIYNFYKLGDKGSKIYKQSIFNYKKEKSARKPKYLYFNFLDKSWQVSSYTFDTFYFGSTIDICFIFKNQILRDLKYCFFVLRLAMIT